MQQAAPTCKSASTCKDLQQTAPISTKQHQPALPCTNLQQSAPSCNDLQQAVPISIKLDQSAPNYTKLPKPCSKPHQTAASWTNLHHSEPTCTKLVQSAKTYTSMQKSASTCNNIHQSAWTWIKVWTYPWCLTNTKRCWRIKQGALSLILFFGWFRRHSMKTWKSSWCVGPAFSSFNPCPSLPRASTDNRKQFQYLNIVLNKKLWTTIFGIQCIFQKVYFQLLS